MKSPLKKQLILSAFSATFDLKTKKDLILIINPHNTAPHSQSFHFFVNRGRVHCDVYIVCYQNITFTALVETGVHSLGAKNKDFLMSKR